jgi:hypothetical protein
VSGLRTTISFDGTHLPLEEASLMAELGYHPGPKYGASFGAGALLGGSLDHRDVGAGVALDLSGSWLALYESETRPFLTASLTLSVSTTKATGDDAARHRLTAGDARLGLMVGKTYGRLVPYAAARVFGGPVFWTLAGKDITGTDTHHFTIGVGTSLRLPRKLEAFVELMPLGEQSASFGLDVSF